MAIWTYLQKELYVLEVPKTIRKEEIGLFFEVCNKKEQEEKDRQTQLQVIKQSGLFLPSSATKSLRSTHSAPEIDAYKYINKFLEFNEDAFIICDHYLDKKIVGTPELELFIRRHFKTKVQLNFYWALVPAYLAIIVSIFLPFIQRQDNTVNFHIKIAK